MDVNQKTLSSPSLVCLVFSVLVYLPIFVTPHQCSRKPVIFNFGDSNSDTGGHAAAYGLELPYPYGRNFFQQPSGRASDGRLIIDFFCEYLNTSYLTPYLDALAEPNFLNGANFAIIGSATNPKSPGFCLDTQVRQFKRFKSRSVALQSQCLNHMMGEENFKNALYMIDIGQNDLSYAFGSLSNNEAIEMIPFYVSEIRNAIWDLYMLGGRKFWVHNTGPLGCLPRELAIRNNVSATDVDEHGCIKSMNDGAKMFNDKLKVICEELQSQMENSIIVYVDVYSIKYDLIANSASYGFNNPLMICCGHGGEPYNYDPDWDCLTGKSTPCEEDNPCPSWDGVHYTEAANVIVASKILSTRYSTPPLEFNFFCNDAIISSS